MKNKKVPTKKYPLQLNKNNPVSQEKPEPINKLKLPIFYNPQPVEYNSNISQKSFNNLERKNYIYPPIGGNDICKVGCPYFNGMYPQIYNWNAEETFFPSIISENGGKEKLQIDKFEPFNFSLKKIDNNPDDFFKPKKNQNITNNETNQNFNKSFLFNIKETFLQKNNNWTPEKKMHLDLNKNMNMNTPLNNNNNNNIIKLNSSSGTKFFTNHNYGYKCSCSKTQCNRNYCECYSSGNYCIDCNCKNCINKPPINSYTNKHPTSSNAISSKNKREKVICTCTKSSCNKNYCECFKSGQKCSSLCRCISCENNDDIILKNTKISNNYKCCLANSIYIVKNNIFIENIEKKDKDIENVMQPNIFELFEVPSEKANGQDNNNDINGNGENIFNRKRKREDIKNSNNEKDNECDLLDDSLFDKNGKVILKHINFFHM